MCAIENAASEAAVNEIVAGAKDAIDAIKTKVEIEEGILADIKTAANEVVDDLKKAVDFDLYNDDAIAQINALYATVKSAIANATTEEEVDAAIEAYRTALAEVPQKSAGSEEDDADSDDEGKADNANTFGCSGVVGGFAYAIVALGAAVVVCKKKEN